MSFYLSICQDDENKEFLLISEQQLDAKLPKIKAQIYFDAPVSKLENNEITLASFGVSKKEVELLLNLAQQRQTNGFRSQGLFADGKVDKKALFNVFSYPSRKQINELINAINIRKPTKEQYIKRVIKQDEERMLENRHHIYWENFLELSSREQINFENWTSREIREIKALNDFNLIRMFLHDNYDIPVEQKI